MGEERSGTRKDQVEIGPLEKNGEKMMASVDAGHMAAVLSGREVMYVFRYRGKYQCFIHPLDAPEGRRKEFEPDERNRAMLKNLDAAADQLFEIKFGPEMDFMGVMAAAERGIINFLDSLGNLPAEDYDFMTAMEKTGEETQ